ncbi:hypothetical protein [Microbispora rosea]|uniref:hypothetical protein n=1 Tax=Microbispora rosea TaxID=58117 RepID=UPI0004C364EA|nr:hypothetical protein [Microbispora rosea]
MNTTVLDLPTASAPLTDPARRWLTLRYQADEKHLSVLENERARHLAEAAALEVLIADLRAEQQIRAARLGGAVSLLPAVDLGDDPEEGELPLEAEAHAAVEQQREHPYAQEGAA